MSHSVTITKNSLKKSCAVAFETLVAGKRVSGIVTRVRNRYFAFQNLCKHLPITLDCGDGKVTSEDNTQLQCHMHGALYDLESGMCTAGPCVGSNLNRFVAIVEGSRIVVKIPPNPSDV